MVQAVLQVRITRLALVLLAGGCSVVDQTYPVAWDAPKQAPDCRRFEGTYADRGEVAGQTARRSLTRELFGEDSPWEKAETVRIELVEDGTVVTVRDGDKPVARHFSAKEGDFRCDQGKLTLRARRWVTSGLMSGRESVKFEAYEADPFLVAHVEERVTGVMFIVVPLSGESARWFRFARLKP
jgi:hypothetical protein